MRFVPEAVMSWSSSCRAAGGLVDAGSEYEKALADEIAKLQRLYGGGDIASFPEFKFTGEPCSTGGRSRFLWKQQYFERW